MSERAIFIEALEKADPAERAAYLDQECAGDAALRQRLQRLLQAYEQAGSFLEAPAASPATSAEAAPGGEAPGAQVGPYKLLQQIGEGGMGVVFMAEQEQPVRRKVALKIIKPGLDSKQVIARFEAERQALALMDHPNIAKVFDAGTTATGRPYFVMELVKGVPLTEYCDQHRLTLRQRLELFVPVCQAVQHAHQKGVIHRDLKPSNVLVALYDGQPVPKVIDFGVAKATRPKLTDRTLFTEFGAIVGTLEYMSPEQAELNQLDIDTRSDVYSLGVLLYELLTGTTPLERKRLREAAFDEMLRIIREEEPPTPSNRLSTTAELPAIAANRGLEPRKLSGLVRGELDWIVMKCLEKDRNRRYETANSLATDLTRYLHDEPVQACPPSAAYRLRKFARRNKQAVAILTALAAILLVAALGLTASTILVWREQGRTQEANLRLKDNLELALQTLDEIYLKVAEERLPRDPARKSEHLELLKRALSFYEQFARQNSTDPEVRKAQAKAHRRAGAIRQLLDQHADAEKDLGRAISLYEALRAERPSDREVRFGLASALLNLALMQYRSGRHTDAVRNLDVGQPLLEELVAEEPHEPGYRRDLAQALNNRGTLLMLERRMPEAQRAYERAAELWDQLIRERPSQLDFQAGQAEALQNLGYLLSNMGRLPEAEDTYHRAIPILERLVQQDPRGAKGRRTHGVAYSNLALLLRRMGRALDAEKVSSEAIRVQQRLVADFGTVPEYQADLALSHLNRTDVLRDLGRFAEAEEGNRESLTYFEQLVKSFPEIPGYRRDQALNYLGLGRAQRLTHKHAEAEHSLRQALAIQEELAAKYPTVPEYQRDQAISWQELGGLLGMRNRRDEAEAAHRKALALNQGLVKGWPDIPEYRHLLAETLYEQARLLRLAKRLDEAESPSVRALELWEQLVAESPKAASYRIGLGGHLNNRGQLFWDRGDLVQARAYFERAIQHQEEARKLDPGSAAARAFLRNHYSNLADVLTRLGKHTEAARAAVQLPQVMPGEGQYQSAAVFLLRCVHLVEKDAEFPAAERTATVQLYTERIRALLEQAERRHAETPVAVSPTPLSWTACYNTACAYALVAGSGNGDPKRKEHFAARAVRLLQQTGQLGKEAELLERLTKDGDLDPLRMRDDFQKLLAELERKKNARP